MRRLTSLALALFASITGLLLGLCALNLILYTNPGLLLRGMAAPAPVDTPLTDQKYDVFETDADLFYWQSDQIRAIAPDQDRLEARVHYLTDEHGFPNKAPVPSKVDVIVIGRSYSMGAQSSHPWVRQFEERTGMEALNLSQTGSGIQIKKQHLEHFGLPHHPDWVILEVLPSMDIIGYSPTRSMIIQELPYPIIQTLARRYSPSASNPFPDAPVYPLELDLMGKTIAFTEFNPYLAALSIDLETLQKSQNWVHFKQDLLDTIQMIQQQGACPAILYAPTKSEVIVPLMQNPDQLEPALIKAGILELDGQMWLVHNPSESPASAAVMNNATAARRLIARFAEATDVPLIDPTDKMAQAVLLGDLPFMEYDTHWSLTGHQIVADLAAATLLAHPCP